MTSAEVVVNLLRAAIVVGLLVLVMHSKWLAAQWWELLKPVWQDVRQWIGQVVIGAGCYVIRLGARLSGIYTAKVDAHNHKKLEVSYE